MLAPRYVLPTSAWKVNNDKAVKADEMRVGVRLIHIETTGFKQIAAECGYHPKAMEKRILDIINKRGKLHNPITNTGGVLSGFVEEIGTDYRGRLTVAPGDEVICNASLAGIPLYLSKINKIDFAYSQIEAEGYAVVSSECPILRRPEDLPVRLLLSGLDESGTLMDVSNCAEGKENFLIVGNNMFSNLLFGLAIRHKTGQAAKVVCLLDRYTDGELKGKYAEALLKRVFTEIHIVDILRPTICIEELSIANSFDLVVNCADIPGAETINVMAAKPGGAAYFTNLINNHYVAAYVTETTGKDLAIKCAQGFLSGYEDFTVSLFRSAGNELEGMELCGGRREDDAAKNREREEFLRQTRIQDSGSLLEDFICESRAMQVMLDQVLSVAKYDCHVLITGETGVGKEKVAALLHKTSARNMKPFVKINCAAISENLIESELFGYERGSFTGAGSAGKKGYFEIADNGIIFLDEVGELPLDLQAKLLRAIQEGEFYKVGGVTPIRTNVRIVSATNRNLLQAVSKNAFRSDLYYRLNVFPIRVPNLDERRSEIPALVRHFLEKYNQKFGLARTITADAVDYLKECKWQGNIRELENVTQRLLISAKSEVITIFDVMRELHTDFMPAGQEDWTDGGGEVIYMEKMVRNFERELIRYALDKHGSTRKAAKSLGISQTQLVRKKNLYEIQSMSEN